MSFHSAQWTTSQENLRASSVSSAFGSIRTKDLRASIPGSLLTPPPSPDKINRVSSYVFTNRPSNGALITTNGSGATVDHQDDTSDALWPYTQALGVIPSLQPHADLTPPPSPVKSPSPLEWYASEGSSEITPVHGSYHYSSDTRAFQRPALNVPDLARNAFSYRVRPRPDALSLPRSSAAGFDGCNDMFEEGTSDLMRRDKTSPHRLAGTSNDEGQSTGLPMTPPASPIHTAEAAEDFELDAVSSGIDDLSWSSILAESEAFDEVTPLTQATPAKGAFPFPDQASAGLSPFAPRQSLRIPSHAGQSFSSPGRGNVSRSQVVPDRFVPSRRGNATPREAYMLVTPPAQLSDVQKRDRQRPLFMMNPFRATTNRGLRHAEGTPRLMETVPIRFSDSPGGPASIHATGTSSPVGRGVSRGSVWSVGGTAHVDGVPSTSDGRGRRVTSSTNAPLYSSEFFGRSKPSDELSLHQRRLESAFEIDQANRVFDSPGSRGFVTSLLSGNSSGASSPNSPTRSGTNQSVAWRDSNWLQSSPISGSCSTIFPFDNANARHKPRRSDKVRKNHCLPFLSEY